MPERLKTLPAFTCINDGDNSINLWPAASAESYRAANELGRSRAEELLVVVRRTQSPMLLGHVVQAIARAGTFGGLEVGFFHALSAELLSPEKITEFVVVPPERQFNVGRKLGHLAVVETESAEARAA